MAYTMDNPFTQIATLSIQGKLSNPENEILFLFVLRGELRAEINGEFFTAGTEDVILSLPSDRLILSGSGTNIVQIIQMKNQFFSLGQSGRIGTYICNSALDKERDYTALRRLLSQIALNSRYQSNVRLLKTMELAYSLLYYLNTYHYVPDLNAGGSSKYQVRTSLILSYLEANYMNDVTLESLAKNIYLTPTYLSRFFKKHIGKNFNEYLKDIRLRHAVNELLETDGKIIDIAVSNGFSGTAVFNKAFLEVYGMSPREYRMKNKNAAREECLEFQASPEEKDAAGRQLEIFSGTYTDEEGFFYPTVKKLSIPNIQKSRKISRLWGQAINIGFIDTQNSALLDSQLQWVQKDIHFRYGRLQGVLTDRVMPRLPDGNYNFIYFDRHIDMLLTRDLTPYLDLSVRANYFFGPELIYAHEEPHLHPELPSREEYARKVLSLIRHCINIYGISQVEKWIFEIGYMHDEHLNPSETPEAFAGRFAESFRNIKALLPDALVGGIVYNLAAGNQFFISLLDALEKAGTSPDFISVCIFPNGFPDALHRRSVQGGMYFSPNPDFALEQLEMVRELVNRRPFFTQKIFVASFGTDIQMRNLVNDTCYQASFLAKMITDFLDRADLIAYWQLSDLTIESPDIKYPLFGGSGLLSVNGLAKPGYYVLKNFRHFKEQLVARGRNYFLCSNTVNTYSLVLFNYIHPSESFYLGENEELSADVIYSAFQDSPTEDITVYLDKLVPGTYKIMVTTLNRKNGSVLDSLARYGITSHMQSEDVEYVREMTFPHTISYFDEIREGHAEFHVQLLPHEVKFFRITRQL